MIGEPARVEIVVSKTIAGASYGCISGMPSLFCLFNSCISFTPTICKRLKVACPAFLFNEKAKVIMKGVNYPLDTILSNDFSSFSQEKRIQYICILLDKIQLNLEI